MPSYGANAPQDGNTIINCQYLVYTEIIDRNMCSGYEKSRHGYGDTHVGRICVDASRRPEIRARRSTLDVGDGKLLVKV